MLSTGPATHASWSRRGEIAVQLGLELYVMRADGTGVRRLTYRGGENPDWSPRGTRLVFERRVRTRHRMRKELFVVDRLGRGLRRLTRRGGRSAAWSPDGSRIAFIRDLEAVPGALHVMRLDGRRLRVLARPRGVERYDWPDWQPVP